MSYENSLFAAIHGEATLYTAFLKPHAFNRYVYCSNNPVRYTDPLGLDAFDNIADFAAGVGDALSFGLTRVVRQIAGTDYIHSEGVYKAGVITGTVADIAAGGVGLVKVGVKGIGKSAGKRILRIGKLKDLKKVPIEETLLPELKDLGSTRLNWRQNASKLRKKLREGYEMMDQSVNRTGVLRDNTGFLRAERNLLKNKNLRYDPIVRKWK